MSQHSIDLMVFLVVVALRLGVPLFVPRFPLPAMIAAMLIALTSQLITSRRHLIVELPVVLYFQSFCSMRWAILRDSPSLAAASPFSIISIAGVLMGLFSGESGASEIPSPNWVVRVKLTSSSDASNACGERVVRRKRTLVGFAGLRWRVG